MPIAPLVAHGPYSLVCSLLTTDLIIRRQDADRKRTVATIQSLDDWDRFITALESGASEVAAVHAIDV